MICKILLTFPKRRVLPCGLSLFSEVSLQSLKISCNNYFSSVSNIHKNRYLIKISHKQWLKLLLLMIFFFKMNLQKVLSFPKEVRPTNVNRSGTERQPVPRGYSSAQLVSRAPQSALKGEMAIYINKEFTPSMFICHPGLPQDLIISLDNRES